MDFTQDSTATRISLALKKTTSQGPSVAPCCSTSLPLNCHSSVSAEKAIKQMGSLSMGKKKNVGKEIEANMQSDRRQDHG